VISERNDVRNVAIIAHVDHGKTTLVDELLKQSGTFRQGQVVQERVMDSSDLERERGITILSKNTAVFYKGIKINIVDTPGHADFGGEVERVLKMVNGVVLVVDAFEGPMPQTRFVLKNAIDLQLPVVVCINKVDRAEARPSEVADEVLELFMELEMPDEQFDSPFVYTSAKTGIAFIELGQDGVDMEPLFDAIVSHVPAPAGDPDAGLQLLISTIDYNEYVGRIGIGKVENGAIYPGMDAVIVNAHEPDKLRRFKIGKVFEFEGLNRVETPVGACGAIVAVTGVSDLAIGDTVCSPDNPCPVPFVKITEPTIAMTFIVNDSPFAGREGKFVTSRHLRERLFKELNTDVSLRVSETSSTEAFKVSGRGELHLSILIETMRREGYEFQVSKPEVLFREENGQRLEPVETVIVDTPDEFAGVVIEKLGRRKAELELMSQPGGGYTRLSFSIPSRGLIGYRGEFLTDTKGNGVLNALFKGYEPYRGDIQKRQEGSLIAFESGESAVYGLYNAQERGELFIGPGVNVYAGMIVGRNARSGDMEVNVCKKKQLTNIRAAGSDESQRLSPPLALSLEQSLDFIADDELVEVTPQNLRMRKKILDATARIRARRK
jgi:GTP-binding protein